MASPHVNGVVALMRQANPEIGVEQIKQIIYDTAYDLGPTGEDNSYGWGMIDAYEAVLLAMDEFVSFNYPNGLPDYVSPDGGTTVRVVVSEDGAPGTGVFYYNLGYGWQQGTMQIVSPNVYDAVFPAVPCYDTINFYFGARDSDNDWWYDPPSAPNVFYSAVGADGIITIFEDNFETDMGWTVENACSDGQWERGIPIGGGDRGDPPTDYDGSGNCYLTDNEDDNSDVDDGYTWLMSPSLNLTGYDATVNYALWYTNNFGGDPNNDLFEVYVSNNNGSSWIHVETFGPQTQSGWRTRSFVVSEFVTPNDQIKVRFEASDLGSGSVVEAGLDAFSVTTLDCGGNNPNVDVDMTPYSTPVQVYAGGSFYYVGELTNHTDDSQIVDVWVMLTLPGGSEYGPVQQFNNVSMSPQQQITVPMVRQNIPTFAPLGTYLYTAYCGEYPDNPWDFDAFPFTVMGVINSDVNEWSLEGWFEDGEGGLPSVTELHGNYPNPFNAATNFNYSLAEDGDVKLEIFNLLGQKVATIVDGYQSAGHKAVNWDASDYSSGVYFYVLSTGEKNFTKRMTLLK